MVLCFREVSNGVEKKGKKKSVGRPPGPYTRKMIQKTAEPSLVREYVGVCCQRGRMLEITEKSFQLTLKPCFKYIFFIFQDKESISENPTLDLPCSIG